MTRQTGRSGGLYYTEKESEWVRQYIREQPEGSLEKEEVASPLKYQDKTLETESLLFFPQSVHV